MLPNTIKKGYAMKFKNVKLVLLTAIFSAFSYIAQAQYLSTKDIYAYAKNRNYYALSKISRYIDMQDGNGNTALCLAVIDNDHQAYNILRQYGANPQPYCLQSATTTSNSSTFLGMGTTGWLTTGAIVAAGAGVAAAAGGGGGGGSSSSDNITPTIACVHGSINGDICICTDGWTGSTCEQAKAVPSGYTLTPCSDGYTQVDTFLSGNDIYYKCEVNDCNGFNYTSCPTGYAQSDSCVSGTETKLKCDNCAPEYEKNYQNECVPRCPDGYGRDGNGDCVIKNVDVIGTTSDTNNDKIQINNSDFSDVYGMKNSSGGNRNSYMVEQGNSEAEITITNL